MSTNPARRPILGRMQTLELERLDTPTDVAQRAADLIGQCLATRPEAVLLMPAGGTPLPLYRELARRQEAGEIDLAPTHRFQLDELLGVEPGNAQSFHSFLRVNLPQVKGADSDARLHLLSGDARDAESEIRRHARNLEELGGADLALLGIGRNGHVAFNEPGTAADAPARVVELAGATRSALASGFADGEVPTRGITLGLREIGAARSILLLATGAAKASVLASLVQGEPTSDCPASLLRGRASLRILADDAACSAL